MEELPLFLRALLCIMIVGSCKEISRSIRSYFLHFPRGDYKGRIRICGILMEGCFHAETAFGYFSNKDGKRHSFDLCEECYDKMIEGFAIPAEEEEISELL